MKDRIRKFIDYKNVTAADLADKLEVQRSNVSHVLNGRNKPGANFIERLLTEYPELNARWLLTGEGEMVTSKKEQVKTLFDAKDMEQIKEELLPVYHTKSKQIASADIKGVGNNPDIVITDKKIEKIVVFFTDKSFREYNPE